MTQGPVGRPLPRFDAYEKAVGASTYSDDLRLPGALLGGVLRSPHPSARLKAIDQGLAERVPGVVAVLTHRDIPGLNFHPNRFGNDHPVLAEDRVRFSGQALALVAAETEEDLEEGLAAIRVEYELLPGVFDPEHALREGPPRLYEEGNRARHWQLTRGDVAAGFAEAAAVVEASYGTPFVDHAFLEPEAGLAWLDKDGVIHIWLSTQHIENYQAVAEVLNLPASRVRIRCTTVGGAFGGKEDPAIEIYLALLCRKTRRPVRMAFTREESMVAHSKKHPFIMMYRTGADRKGRLTALQAELIADVGAHIYLSPMVTLNATLIATGPYRIPNVRVDTYALYTNNPFTSSMRGVGCTQVTFAMESQMDELAARLGLDPLEFRKRNYLRPGDQMASGQRLERPMPLAETAERALTAIGPLPSPSGPGKRVGRGLASNLTGYGKPGRKGSALVAMGGDGRVSIRTGAPDVGGGQCSSYVQIASEVLGISPEAIRIYNADTATTPLSGITAGSMQLTKAGNAILSAARKLRQTLFRQAAELLEAREEDLTLSNGRIGVLGTLGKNLPLSSVIAACEEAGVSLQCEGSFEAPAGSFDAAGTSEGNGWLDYTVGTQVADVEVDEETGEVRVLRLSICHDVGRAINPQSVEGQLEGGAVMGLGYALMEEFLLEEGRCLTGTLHEFLIPTSLDSPEAFSRYLESAGGIGPLGARGIGEPPCNVPAAAIANAIRAAVGVRMTSLPITPEKVALALRKEGAQRGEENRGR